MVDVVVVLSVVVVSSDWISETDSSPVPDEQVIKTKHNKNSFRNLRCNSILELD